MYNRDFGGIKSDGQLREFENSWQSRSDGGYRACPSPEPPGCPVCPPPEQSCPKPSKRLFDFGFLRDIQIDDLILIGIGILLLLDSDANNDMLVLLILALLIM